jgi:hypothetical protein
MPATITLDQRRALELIAAETAGCPECLLVAQGFNLDFLGELVRSGLAGVEAERSRDGSVGAGTEGRWAPPAFRLLITTHGRQVIK